MDDLIEEHAIKALQQGKSTFQDAMWNDSDFDEYFNLEKVSQMLKNGLELQLMKLASLGQEAENMSLKSSTLLGLSTSPANLKKRTAW